MDARKNVYRFAAIVTVGAGGLLVVAAPAEAQADPPGNNGTVKIDAAPFDDLPDNEPHDPCVFQVDFYGFDAGVLDATVTFTAVPPTAADQDLLVDTVPIGEDAAGGGTDLDASRTYDLTPLLAGIEPHPQQGFHVRLTVHADGSQGADTKFKEFWVGPCGDTPPTTAPPTTAPPTTGGPPTTPIEPGSGPGTPPGTPPGGGPGATITPSATAPGTLPRTGSNALPLVAAGLALAGLGSGIVLAARTRRQS
jgi:LPXTG-motif cell wall-anchored protein